MNKLYVGDYIKQRNQLRHEWNIIYNFFINASVIRSVFRLRFP